MKQFNPPIAERSTPELIVIARDERGEWHPDAMDQAKEELKRRRVSYQDQRNISAHYNELREKQEAYIREQKKNEPLSVFEILKHLHHIPLFPFAYFAYRSYKADGYDTKAEQMLIFLKLSGIIILAFIVYAILH